MDERQRQMPARVLPCSRLYCARADRGCFRKIQMKKLALVLSLLACSVAFAHSGGTDKNGCHNERKTGGYHCH